MSLVFPQIAQLNVKINELKDLQDEAIKSEDFGKAQELKNEISECQDKVLLLKASLMGSFVSSSSEVMEEDEDEEVKPKIFIYNVSLMAP